MDLRKWALRPLAAIMLSFALHAGALGATLLPDGKQQFVDGNGVPLSGGTVYMYVPSTSICKNTYQDAAQTMLNACPIILDSAGRAIIYGTGTYRQVVYACSTPPTNCDSSTGILQYDALTTDTSASNSVFWAGLAGGTPNAITVTDASFNSTDGSVIQFIPIFTNTAATTLTPSGTGVPIAIVKDTASGAVALSGGEIVASSPSNVVSVVYSASQNNFHLLNLVNTSLPTTVQTLCGATGLKITNNSGTPATQITITADQTTVINASALTVSRMSVSYTLNITLGTSTAAANGMDGEVPGTSAWLYIWIIDNGSQGASLASLSATAPTMPSGYSYKCRLGAMRVDGSGNLMRTVQLGSRAQYTVQASGSGGNTTVTLLNAANGAAGSSCLTNAPVYANLSIANFVPPQATSADVITYNFYSGLSLANVLVASNGNWGGPGPTTAVPFSNNNSPSNNSQAVNIVLESTQQVSWCSSAAGGSLYVSGWRDKVNAN